MKSLSVETILVSAFLLASPIPIFGRGEAASMLRYSQALYKGTHCRNHSIGARSGGYVMTVTPGGAESSIGQHQNLGDAVFRR
jgi:hypothetical protein